MTEPLRKPEVFSVDDARVAIAEADDAQPADSAAMAAAEIPVERLPAAPARARRRVRWGALFFAALSGLILLGLGVAVTSIVEELFARAAWLGAVGLGLAALAGLALLVLIAREIAGLARLERVESLRRRAQGVIDSDDRERGRELVAAVLSLARHIPRLARARARLEGHRADIIDGRDLVRLAERELMAPLDAEARQLIAAASKRVSVVTAISPRAVVDIVFVLVNALSLIRGLAVLYGGRPGTLGVLRLFRQVVTHLAVTGGVALSDSVLQQVVGQGLAARLSARLGEGIVNGLLTARLGLLAVDLVRPLPFYELPRPTLNDLASGLLRSSENQPAAGGVARTTPPGGQ
jgi:putative membrane protein